MKALFRTMAHAGRWANQILFAELRKLTPVQWTQQSAVNFGSIQGIANHLLVADATWLLRFSGEPIAYKGINPMPHPGFEELWAARQAEDERIIAFIEALDPARLGTTLCETLPDGTAREAAFNVCLAHFFNHQTHHRGQMHALLGVHGIKCPDIDLLYFPGARGG